MASCPTAGLNSDKQVNGEMKYVPKPSDDPYNVNVSSILSPFRVRCSSEVVHSRQGGILGHNRHHASRRHEHPLHVDSTLFVPQNPHHRLSCDLSF